MSTIELFGPTWNNECLNHELLNINVLTNDKIGKVVFTFNCLQTIGYDNEWQEEDFYKLISLIHEKTILGKPYFIYKEEEHIKLEKIMQERNREYTFIEKNYVLIDFPKNIIDLQRRSLLLLHRQYPRYGDYIEHIQLYDFFSEGYSDWAFVLEAMKQKNWINIEIRRAGDGSFRINSPFLITEKGWFEIEKDLEMNYSKQVFVAMWFDNKMDKVAEKIEKAIKDSGLKAMIIKKKEHNNEISGEILYEIMNSRIIIADVTGQRNGVYFEAGFALGHKKNVIWSCQKDDLKNIHFDTRQYNHIVWDNEEDLYIKLKDRILATLTIET
jgi:nucleoside 2-deoxyribosyltransferase